MLGSDTVEVAIGLTLLFLFVSLICTAIREAIETFMKTRAHDLERGIRELLNDPKGELTETLYSHPLIYSLFSADYRRTPLGRKLAHGGNLPSYIPSGQFASAIIDIAAHGARRPDGSRTGPMTIEELRKAACKLQNQHLRSAILSAIDHADGDLARVKTNLEAWFDGTMDRVSGWYKRRTQVLLFLIGLAAAVIINVDTLTIAQRMVSDSTLRKAMVAQAEAAAEQTPAGARTARELRQELDEIGAPLGWKDGWPAAQVRERRSATPVKASWPVRSASNDRGRYYVLPFNTIVHMTLGWLITALAVMLGAPFWFDVLNKIMVIRSTVKPTEKSPVEGSEDRRAGRTLELRTRAA